LEYGTHFITVQVAPFSRTEISKQNWTDFDADKTLNRMSDSIHHPTNLSIAPFVKDHLDNRGTTMYDRDFRRRRWTGIVIKGQTIRKAAQGGWFRSAKNRNVVRLAETLARMCYFVNKVAIV
jgi:hypothetical protein